LRSGFPFSELLDTFQAFPIHDEDATCSERPGGKDKSQDGKRTRIDVVQDIINLEEGDGKPDSEYKRQLRSVTSKCSRYNKTGNHDYESPNSIHFLQSPGPT